MLCLVLKAVQAVQHSGIVMVVSMHAQAAIQQVWMSRPWASAAEPST